MYADENVIKIKHRVLREVAKLAFEGNLDSERDHIAVRLIPGPTPEKASTAKTARPYSTPATPPRSAAGVWDWRWQNASWSNITAAVST